MMLKDKMKKAGDDSPLTPLHLYVPEEEAYNKATYFLNVNGVAILKDWAASLHALTWNVSIQGEAAGTFVEKNISSYMEKRQAPTKNLLVPFLAVFLGDWRNFKLYIDTLPPEVQLVWKVLVKNRFIGREELDKMIERECLVRNGRYDWNSRMELSDEFSWFVLTSGKPSGFNINILFSISYYISLPYFLQVLLVPLCYKEQAYTWHTFPELPAEEPELQVFNAEKLLFSEMITIDGLSKQDLLVTNDKWKMSAATVRKLSTQSRLREFFPDSPDKSTAILRAGIVFPIFGSIWKFNIRNMNKPELSLREMFMADFFKNYHLLVPCLLPHITGVRSSEIREGLFFSRMKEFLEYVMGKNTKEWISFEDCLLSYRHKGHELGLLYIGQLEKAELSNKQTGNPIYLIDLYKNLTKPFFKSLIFLLASLGMMEIACRESKDTDCSPFDPLRYFRVTDLGSYVFGLTNTYKRPEVEACTSLFELDEHNLIVRSLEKENPYLGLLLELTEPIGNQRYRVTHASLLNSCVSRRDVESRINFFKQFISNQLPDIWKEFFDSLLRRCAPLKQLSTDKYLIYQLDANNLELHKLILSDPIIRQCTVRAEGFLLLIEADKSKVVLARLKSFGYLL